MLNKFITSRSTGVMGLEMAQPDNNNTLSSAFKTFFEREKLTATISMIDEPPANAAENVKAAWKAEYKIHSDVACLMLGKMSPCSTKAPPAVEIYDLVDTLHSCKQAPGKSVSAHVLEMKGYMDQLQALGKPYDNDMWRSTCINGP
ncbi:hypothetical protein Tco_0519541 [Tanacetum coccineum]